MEDVEEDVVEYVEEETNWPLSGPPHHSVDFVKELTGDMVEDVERTRWRTWRKVWLRTSRGC